MQEELNKLKGDHKIPFRVLVKKTMHYVKPEWLSFVLALLLIGANVGLDLYLPRLVMDITDELLKDSFEYSMILKWSILYISISFASMVFIYFESMLLQRAGQRIIYKLRIDIFEHIQNMSQNQFNEMPVGSLVTRVANYTQSMSDLFTNVLVNIVKNAVYVVAVYVYMYQISWQLSIIMLGPVTIVAISSFIFSRVVHKIFRNERAHISDMNTYLNENLSGMKITQIFNQQEYKEEEFNKKNRDLFKARFGVTVCFGIYRPFITLVYMTSVAICFYFGFQFGLAGGAVVAFYMYLSKFFNPVQQLADQLNNLSLAVNAFWI